MEGTQNMDALPDPLFNDAPDYGEALDRRGVVQKVPHGGYRWRKAQGTVCGTCGETIEGRRYEVQSWKDMPGLGRPADPWHHVRCFDWTNLERAIRKSGRPDPREPARPGTKTWMKQVEKAKAAGTRIELDPFFLEREYGVPVS